MNNRLNLFCFYKNLYIWVLQTKTHHKQMKKILLLIIFFSGFLGFSQQNFWTQTDEDRIADLEKLDRNTLVTRYEIYQLNFEGLKNALSTAPDRDSGLDSNLILSFPNADGRLMDYKVYEASIMHPELSARHPNIKSYVGVGLQDRTATIRFSTTIFGFHGMIFSGPTGTAYIDPYTKDLNKYIVYFKKNTVATTSFECLTEGIEEPQGKFFGVPPIAQESTMLDGSLRKFRLAMACTIEYAAFHVNAAGLGSGTLAQKKAAVLAAMNVTMTRVNGIYERDLSVTMEFVPNNEDVIFITSDNFNNNNAGVLINQSQSVIDATIGFSNYDIGHTVSTGDGGLAQMFGPCSPNKARGITGSPSPVGDPFDVDYVAHEMGHQYGANHTFNNSCGGNRNNSTAVEPGSGSTIMGYAGICAPNVQNNSDAYFHAISLTEIRNFLLTASCSNNTNNGNTKPTISPLTNYTIPKGTAFVLKGNATDADGDALTYCWEQTNQQVSTQPPSATSTQGPNFRSLAPSTSPNRYMPSLSSVLQGVLTPTWEVVPNVGRTMNFALVVRDNKITGGEFARANMTVTTSSTSGPFTVTSQTSNINWEANSQQTITWDVAGTTASPINTSHVNILLSTNGGASFDHVLAANTPNDGSETITVPNVATANARIMVEAVGNIFYAVNSSPFSIGDCNYFIVYPFANIPDGVGPNQAGTPLVSTINVPNNFNINDVKVSVDINHTWNGDLVIRLEHPNGTQVTLWNRTCNAPSTSGINVTFQNGAPAIVCASPTSGTYSPVGDLSVLNGLSGQGTWKLIITDNYNSDTGSLVAWALDFGCTASTTNFDALNFKVYPNPNKGNFTLEFDSTSTDDIKVEVYDIRGRKIFAQNYQNTGSFAQQINLTDVQTGIYIMNVSDGKQTQTRKIVVE